MSQIFKDHFSEKTAAYAAYRPSYPAALADFLASVAPAKALALDCGCGSGQLSVLLAKHFDVVVATDASASQVENAAPHANVTYRCAPAEHSGLEDNTVDLVVAAQAAHWFDLDAFYSEARRAGRAGAAIALVSYGPMCVDAAADPVIEHFYRKVIGPYWPPERRHVEDGYRSFPFPFSEVDTPELAIEVDWSLADYLGYVGTWSSVRGARKATGKDPMPAFANALSAVWGSDDVVRRVRWPIAMRVGHIERVH